MKQAYFLLGVLLILFSCAEKKNLNQSDTELPDYFIKNELMVQLKPHYSAESLCDSFTKEEMQLKEELSKHLNVFLFTYNDSKVQASVMFERVKNHEAVQSVEFNNKLETRE